MERTRDQRGTPHATGTTRSRSKSAGCLVGSLLAVTVASAGWAAPAGAESAARLEQQGVTRIIVKRAQGLSAAKRADIRADADVELVRRLALPETEVVEAPAGGLIEALAALRSDPDVAYAEPDAPIASAAADLWWGELWGLENVGQQIENTLGVDDADIDAREAWRTSTGAGVTVAVIDSGLDAGHADLAGREAINPGESGAKAANGIDDDSNGYVDDFRGWDWVGRSNAADDGNPATPKDEDNAPEDGLGHGTHVAGIIAAQRDNSIGVAGIAPDSSVLALRVLDANNRGVLSDAAEAFHYAGKAGVRVANASLGLRGTLDSVKSLQDAIAAHPQTLYVLAAGNSGTDSDATPFYPCALPEANIVCVGASNNRDEPASFSNYGARSVDLHAPGERIRSTTKGGYELKNGTSMAAPFVAGTAALVADAHPRIGAAGLKRRILDGADRHEAFGTKSLTGARLNAAAAVGAPVVVPIQTPASQPEPTPEPSRPVAAPVVPTATAPRAAVTPPELSGVALSSQVLRRWMELSFRLDRKATVGLTLSRKSCRGKRCTYKVARRVTIAGRPGLNRYALQRRAGRRSLDAGTYKLTVQAREGARRSVTRSTGLTVR